jgi:hypothetical protein
VGCRELLDRSPHEEHQDNADLDRDDEPGEEDEHMAACSRRGITATILQAFPEWEGIWQGKEQDAREHDATPHPQPGRFGFA